MGYPYDSSSATDWASVTAGDSGVGVANGDVKGSRALYIGVTGDVALTSVNGNSVTFASVPVGIFPLAASRVKATGTTATGIKALY